MVGKTKVVNHMIFHNIIYYEDTTFDIQRHRMKTYYIYNSYSIEWCRAPHPNHNSRYALGTYSKALLIYSFWSIQCHKPIEPTEGDTIL